ncbi:MBL fold metallo-hydrolase, partial [Stenotrophomonas sp. HMWF003]
MPNVSRTTLALALTLGTALAVTAPAISHAAAATAATAEAHALQVQPYHPGDKALFSVASTLVTGRREAILI